MAVRPVGQRAAARSTGPDQRSAPLSSIYEINTADTHGSAGMLGYTTVIAFTFFRAACKSLVNALECRHALWFAITKA